MNALATTFDYAVLDIGTAEEIKASAERVRTIWKRTTEDVIEIGRVLREVKDRLPHGQFGPWLKKEFEWTERMAQIHMRAADQFGDKPESVSHLQPTALYLLSSPSTPESLRHEIIERAASGEAVAPAEIRERLSEHRRREREAKEAAERSPAAQRAAKRRAETRARELEDWRREQEEGKRQQQADAEKVAAFLLPKLSPPELFALLAVLDCSGRTHCLSKILKTSDDATNVVAMPDRATLH